MPRSFKVEKPIDIQKGRDEGPNKLRYQEAARRKLAQQKLPLNPTGRRRENKLNIKAGGAPVGGNNSLVKRLFNA